MRRVARGKRQFRPLGPLSRHRHRHRERLPEVEAPDSPRDGVEIFRVTFELRGRSHPDIQFLCVWLVVPRGFAASRVGVSTLFLRQDDEIT